MINTTSKLASFWRFSRTTGSLPSYSLATILPPLATRHYLLRPSPAGDCLPPTAQLPKTERARSRRAALYLSMSPNQAIFTDKIICSSPLAAAHPLSVLSWPRRSTPVSSGVGAGWPKATMPVLSSISRNPPKQLGMVSPELNRKRKPKWRRCVAASIAVGPSAILTGSRTRPRDWGSNARFGPVEDRRNNRRLAAFTCTLCVLQIWWLSRMALG